MNLRFFIHNIHLLHLLPALYREGKAVKASVPTLPEAKGTNGLAESVNNQKLNLLCIGESTIAGVGVKTHEEGFSGTLAKELSNLVNKEIHWEVVAKSGYTARLVKERLVPMVKMKPDVIVVGLGGNDGFQLNSPRQWRRDIIELVDALKALNPKAAIFFSNMPPIHLFPAFTPLIKKVIGDRVIQLAETLNQTVEDMENVFYANEWIDLEIWAKRYNVDVELNTFFSDGVHPSILTYQVWAKDMAKFITSNLS